MQNQKLSVHSMDLQDYLRPLRIQAKIVHPILGPFYFSRFPLSRVLTSVFRFRFFFFLIGVIPDD